MPRRTLYAFVIAAGVAGAGLGGLGVAVWPTTPPPPAPARALSLAAPMTHDLLDIALSRDATRVAYTAIVGNRTTLFVRPLDRFDAQPVPGTEGAVQPFFSPDGSAVAFFADGRLQTVTLDDPSAVPSTVCEVPGRPAGGVWLDDGVIVFAGPGASGLHRVAATGGTTEPLTTIDTDAGESAHGWPSVVDGRHLLFTVGRFGHDPRLTLLDLESGDTRPLLLADGGGFVVSPSALLYARRGEVFAARLELDEPSGAPSPRPVLGGVASSGVGYHRLGRARFAAAPDGTMVFVPPPASGGDTELVWVDREGRAEAIDGVVTSHGTPRVAPNGLHVAFSTNTEILQRDLWRLDLQSGTRDQLTSRAGDNHSPLWSADGTTLTFASSRTGLQRLFRLHLRRGDVDGPLVDGDQRTPGAWSPDGARLVFHEVHPERGRDIWQWSNEAAAPWLATEANERAPRFSPDGRWIVYVSDEEGEGDQVYLRSAGATASGLAVRVSPVGGTEPVWSRDGDTLYFRRGRGLYAVTVDGPEPRVGEPRHLFDGRFVSDVLDNLPAYDVASDDVRFIMLRLGTPARLIHLFSGWQTATFPPPAD